MEVWINIALALSALFLGVVAIGGETWKKEEHNVFRRITIRGWIGITLLIITFGLTVVKGHLASLNQAALKERSDDIALNLKRSQAREKGIADELLKTKSSILKKNEEIQSLQARIIKLSTEMNKMLKGTAERISRQYSRIETTAISANPGISRSDLFVYAEDKIEYTIVVGRRFQAEFIIGSYSYPITGAHGEFMVQGIQDKKMKITVRNRGNSLLGIKMSLYSTRSSSDYQ